MINQNRIIEKRQKTDLYRHISVKVTICFSQKLHYQLPRIKARLEIKLL